MKKFFTPLFVALILFSAIACGGQQGTTTDAKPVTTEKTETTTVAIPFTSTSENDPNLAQGQTTIKQAGVNGSKEVKIKITLVDGSETKREPLPDVITLQPVPQITSVGTYVAPAPAPAPTPAPSSNPQGATARCNDGTYSYSANRSGTCSHHGGVAEWY